MSPEPCHLTHRLLYLILRCEPGTLADRQRRDETFSISAFHGSVTRERAERLIVQSVGVYHTWEAV